MTNPSAAVAARYEQIAAERATHGAGRSPLGREESRALYRDLYGQVPDDPQAAAWARRLFGEVGSSAA